MSIEDLRNSVRKAIRPLIGPRYVLLEIPYYDNIGDILIWEGEKRFLSGISGNIGYSSSYSNYDDTKRFSKDTTILLQGGGNWGDIWQEPHAFRKRIVSLFPENRVIVFPQTIYFQERRNMLEDSKFWSQYPNVTICARDAVSFELLKTYYATNPSLLLPDMAFFIDIPPKLYAYKGERVLFARRTDKEFDEDKNYSGVPTSSDIHDWPTLEGKRARWYGSQRIIGKVDQLLGTNLKQPFVDAYWDQVIRPQYVKMGMDFLRDYHTVYTTRLHIGILATLMGKRVYFLDNNYGKLSSFYSTWMEGFSNVSLL